MTSTTADQYCVVQTTIAEPAQAEALARAVVEARLGACVQVQPIRSYYTWKDETRADAEQLLTIKTRWDCYQQLESLLRAQHPYDVPEIIALPITHGSAAYFAWIDEVTRR